jgi:hypothetical protein
MKTRLIISMILGVFLLNSTVAPAQSESDSPEKEQGFTIPFPFISKDTVNVITTSKDEFLKAEKLISSDPDYQITSFTSLLVVNGDVVLYKSSDNKLQPEFRKAISRKGVDFRTWIEEITAISKDGIKVKLPSVILKLQ